MKIFMFIILISFPVYADPGVICYSNVDGKVTGCNCPGTCTCKNCVIGSQPGGCETKVPCGLPKSTVILAEAPIPRDIKLTITNSHTDKVIYTGYLSSKEMANKIHDEIPYCLDWTDEKTFSHSLCIKEGLFVYVEEVATMTTKKGK
jgi:hypothetical protein